MSMDEKRYIRFATIEGIQRGDLQLAAEVWLQDLKQQSWATRNTLKLAILFTRYMASPKAELVRLGYIERTCRMDKAQTIETLELMQIYGAVEAFSLDGSQLKVSLNLSLLHRLSVLEARFRFAELCLPRARNEKPFSAGNDDKWRPKSAVSALDPESGNDDLLSEL